MQILVIHPEYLIPWEQPLVIGSLERMAFEEKERKRSIDEILEEAKENPFRSFSKNLPEDAAKGWSNVPLIPLFDAPEDLRSYGTHVLYNGNHRRFAANEAGISIPVLLLENDADLSALQKYRPKECKKILEGLSFEQTRNAIWENARKYVNHEMQLPF